MFSFSAKKEHYVVDDVSDEEGWESVKNVLLRQIAGNSIPTIYADSIEDGYILVLHHEHDGRDLEISYAEKVVKHITQLWGSEVKLITMVDDAPYEI